MAHGESGQNGFVWGGQPDTTFREFVPPWFCVPSGKHFLEHKAPSLFVYFFAINTAVIVWICFHCLVLSVNCYLNPWSVFVLPLLERVSEGEWWKG